MALAENLATWWLQATEGVNHYRAELPARFLPGQCRALNIHYDVVPHWSGVENEVDLPTQEGVAICMFPGNNTRAILMRAFQEKGIPALVEADDLYFVPPVVPWMTSWQRKYQGDDQHSYEIHSRIVPWADGAIVSTPQMAREYGVLNPNVWVCPNAVDPADWDPNPKHQDGGILRIGWAASDSHMYDAALIQRALSWASFQDGVEVVILGIETAKFPYRHRFIPFAPVDEYRVNLQEIDVMLTPLKPGRWSNCKSDVKALEAAMAGAMSVVSREEPYRPWFNGPAMTASSPKEFLKAVRYLVQHRDEVRDMAAKAKEYVLRERSYPDAVEPWREAIECVSTRRTNLAA